MAFAVVQEIRLLPPAEIEAGAALSATVGVGVVFGTSEIEALLLAAPPAPLHERVYTPLEVGETVAEPDTDCAPLHAPDAMQPVASVVVQVRVLLPPNDTLAGLALTVTVGAADVAGVPPPHALSAKGPLSSSI